MMAGRIWWTGYVQQLTCNDKGLSMQREPILAELRQRSRDVCQGPDGSLDVLTDEDLGALLSIEPAP
jgi:glucose/arabinose dehydrogenase